MQLQIIFLVRNAEEGMRLEANIVSVLLPLQFLHLKRYSYLGIETQLKPLREAGKRVNCKFCEQREGDRRIIPMALALFGDPIPIGPLRVRQG
ncbi:hypothetical protein PoB_004346700 [Plakobranchus ocellatus]|uniref:Uncharacterized protein n=1 Tax=Plakobranchus ocellatus TaxID=259542 RepID=A0AAV4BCQ7_9GAST|nr:hypothetical protein PoB_004346700 [Plakobranchus ocellatus]